MKNKRNGLREASIFNKSESRDISEADIKEIIAYDRILYQCKKCKKEFLGSKHKCKKELK